MPPAQPDDARREELERALSDVVSRIGWERFVCAPLVLPTPEFFPDRYSHDAHGVRTVARRLGRLVSMDEIELRVIDARDADRVELIETTSITLLEHGEGAAVLEIESLGPPEDVPLFLSNVIARVFRRVEGLDHEPGDPYRGAVPRDEDQAEQRAQASVVEVALGLGVLAANGAHRYRAAGRLVGRDAHTAWVHEQAGGLGPIDVTYLLAVQLAVRGDDVEEIARVLGPNQAADLRLWFASLAPRADALREQLGLPSEDEWPAPWEPDLSALPEQDDDEDDEDDEDDRDETGRAHRPRRTYRIRETYFLGPALLGAVGGFISGVLFLVILPSAMSRMGTLSGWMALVGLFALAGAVIAVRLSGGTRWYCTANDCGKRLLDPSSNRCPSCGRPIAGDVRSQREAIEREWEAEEQERKRKR